MLLWYSLSIGCTFDCFCMFLQFYRSTTWVKKNYTAITAPYVSFTFKELLLPNPILVSSISTVYHFIILLVINVSWSLWNLACRSFSVSTPCWFISAVVFLVIWLVKLLFSKMFLIITYWPVILPYTMEYTFLYNKRYIYRRYVLTSLHKMHLNMIWNNLSESSVTVTNLSWFKEYKSVVILPSVSFRNIEYF